MMPANTLKYKTNLLTGYTSQVCISCTNTYQTTNFDNFTVTQKPQCASAFAAVPLTQPQQQALTFDYMKVSDAVTF